MRIEHWEVARAQGATVARGDARRAAADYDEVPYFWSDLADWASLEYVGPAGGWDREVVRGSLDDGEFTIFYLDGGRVAGALTVGRCDDLEQARELIASSGEPVAPRRRSTRRRPVELSRGCGAVEAAACRGPRRAVGARGSGGPPVQDPAAVGAALDLAARDQLAERGGDRRAAGADHAGQRAVRQAQVDEHAAGRRRGPSARPGTTAAPAAGRRRG